VLLKKLTGNDVSYVWSLEFQPTGAGPSELDICLA